MRFVDPKNDVAFKKVFADKRHKHVLINFLNSILDLPSNIKDLTIVRTDQVPVIEFLKETSLDIKAIDENGREFVIEMQVEDQKDFQNRSLYYAAKSYSQQIKKAEFYTELNPVIFLGILNFTLFDGENFLTNHYFINKQTGNRDIEDLELNFIELPKFTKKEEECLTDSDKWIYFLKNADDLRVIPETITAEPLQTAYQTLEQYGWSQAELDLYDARSRLVASQIDAHETAKYKGKLEGKIEGKLEGKIEGEKIGLEKGKIAGEKNKELEIAKNLLDVLDNKTISQKVGLSEVEIEKLRNSQ